MKILLEIFIFWRQLAKLGSHSHFRKLSQQWRALPGMEIFYSTGNKMSSNPPHVAP